MPSLYLVISKFTVTHPCWESLCGLSPPMMAPLFMNWRTFSVLAYVLIPSPLQVLSLLEDCFLLAFLAYCLPWFTHFSGKDLDFPGGSAVKESASPGRPGFDLWFGEIPWRREWLPAPVFWPGEFHGLQSMGLQRVGHFLLSVKEWLSLTGKDYLSLGHGLEASCLSLNIFCPAASVSCIISLFKAGGNVWCFIPTNIECLLCKALSEVLCGKATSKFSLSGKQIPLPCRTCAPCSFLRGTINALPGYNHSDSHT